MMFSLPAVAQKKFSCLPADISTDTVVSRTSGPKSAIITVGQTLARLKAKCKAGKLIDKKGKEIRFYKLQGCWGQPPPNSGEILERQAKELSDLKKKYTVIEMTCNPSGYEIY